MTLSPRQGRLLLIWNLVLTIAIPFGFIALGAARDGEHLHVKSLTAESITVAMEGHDSKVVIAAGKSLTGIAVHKGHDTVALLGIDGTGEAHLRVPAAKIGALTAESIKTRAFALESTPKPWPVNPAGPLAPVKPVKPALLPPSKTLPVPVGEPVVVPPAVPGE